jgi:DNA-directed RNA polymerase alpha subunit
MTLDIIRVELGVWAYNRLRRDGIDTIERLAAHTDAQLLMIPGFGPRSLAKVHQAVAELEQRAVVS